MNDEIWKDIKGYEGLYQASNLGRIKSLKNNIILKGWKDKYGYVRVYLCENGNKKVFQVHRIVGITFIPNPENKPCINHLDENPSNNNVNNLSWCTYKENNNYGQHNTKMSASKIGNIAWNKGKKMNKEYVQNNYKCKKVNQYDINMNFIKTWESVNEARRTLNIKNISACCKGKYKTAGRLCLEI